MAVTFQKCARETSHVGKDKLYGVGKSEHVLLAREGRKVKIIAILYVSVVSVVPAVSAVPAVSFRWFHSGVPCFSAYLKNAPLPPIFFLDSNQLTSYAGALDLWVGHAFIPTVLI